MNQSDFYKSLSACSIPIKITLIISSSLFLLFISYVLQLKVLLNQIETEQEQASRLKSQAITQQQLLRRYGEKAAKSLDLLLPESLNGSIQSIKKIMQLSGVGLKSIITSSSIDEKTFLATSVTLTLVADPESLMKFLQKTIHSNVVIKLQKNLTASVKEQSVSLKLLGTINFNGKYCALLKLANGTVLCVAQGERIQQSPYTLKKLTHAFAELSYLPTVQMQKLSLIFYSRAR